MLRGLWWNLSLRPYELKKVVQTTLLSKPSLPEANKIIHVKKQYWCSKNFEIIKHDYGAIQKLCCRNVLEIHISGLTQAILCPLQISTTNI